MADNKAKPDCKTCNHKDHKPGQCKQCNCGENELVRFVDNTNRYSESDFGDRINKIYNHQDTLMGERNYKVSRL